jgi:hypothetical protein
MCELCNSFAKLCNTNRNNSCEICTIKFINTYGLLINKNSKMKLIKPIYRLLLLIPITVVMGNAYGQSCPAGLASYWKMDETNSTVLSDNAGGNTAKSNFNPSNDTIGIIGNAKIFNGTNCVDIPDNAMYNFATNSGFSIELWVKLPSVSKGNQVFIGKNDFHGTGSLWYVGVENGKPFFYLGDASGLSPKYITDTNAINDGNWHLIVAVRDGALNKNFLYVDGNIVDQTTYDYLSNFTSSSKITVGYLLSNSLPAYYYTGSLDEIAIYNKALSQADIINHKIKGNGGLGYCDGYNPKIISIPNIKATVGNTYTYKITSRGLPEINYTLIHSPLGMNISPTGVIEWKPDSINIDALVIVRVDNGISPADTQSFRIFISEGLSCPSDLILLLKLDETSGPIYSDYYGEHNAKASTSPSQTAGIIKGGQIFNIDTKLDIPIIASEFDWSASSSFSFECWIKTSAAATMEFLARHRLDSEKVAFWYVGTDKLSGSYAEFEVRDNGDNIKEIIGTSVINDGIWHHILAVRDGAIKKNILYVDGVEEASTYMDYPKSFIAGIKSEINIGYLHRATKGEPEYHFIGSMDEIAIYNRAVSALEAASDSKRDLPEGHCSEGNFAPVVISTPITLAAKDEPYSYKIIAEDIDTSDVIALSAVALPNWLNFNPNNGLLTGIPLLSNAGENLVILSVSDGLNTVKQKFNITITNGTAIANAQNNDFIIYPVPANNEINIKFKNLSEETIIDIISSTGNIIQSKMIPANSYNASINLQNIENGIYFCHFKNDNTNGISRFIVAR